MSEHIYISAAPPDALLVDQLRQRLQQEGYTVGGNEGSTNTSQSIQTCRALVIVVSSHSINDQERHTEWMMALQSGKPLLPLVVGEVSLPPILRRRRPIPMNDPESTDMITLLQHLTWLRSPRGEIQVLRDRMADLERMLAQHPQHPKATAIRAQADTLRQEIADREHPIKQREQDAEEGEQERREPVPTPFPPQTTRKAQHADWGEAPDMTLFYGRTHELDELTRWIVSDRCRMVGILAMGGMGKTSLVTKLTHECQGEFSHILWKSLRNAPPLADLLGECIIFLSNQQRTDLPDDPAARIGLLLDYFRQQRCILVLDNMETILQGGNRTGAYRDGYEGYGDLLQRVGESQHQSVLLLTSREKPREFARLEGTASPVRTWNLSGIHQQEGQAILQDKGLSGSDADWEDLVNRFSGNPLALKLTAETIREIFGGDIADFLSEGETMLSDISDVLAQQFSRLSELEREILYWLAIEREPVSADELRATIVAPGPKRVFLEALGDLRRRSLVEQGAMGFTLQNVVMEYATEQLIDQVCEEIQRGEAGVLNTHALMKAQAKEYVRNSQVRLILGEAVERLLQQMGSREAVVEQLSLILARLREAMEAR